jgi:hypothetical protein
VPEGTLDAGFDFRPGTRTNVSQRTVVVGGSGGGHDHRVGRYRISR